MLTVAAAQQSRPVGVNKIAAVGLWNKGSGSGVAIAPPTLDVLDERRGLWGACGCIHRHPPLHLAADLAVHILQRRYRQTEKGREDRGNGFYRQ
jgi:hypothetical protein